MSLDDDPKLKRALGLSSKSIVRHWKKAGVGNIPGYATHYERLASGSKYVSRVGHLGILLDSSTSAFRIHEACTVGTGKQCQVVSYREGGRLTGSVAGGAIGSGASLVCLAFAITSAGVGGVACAVIVGGLGAATGGNIGADEGERFGEVLRETIHE